MARRRRFPRAAPTLLAAAALGTLATLPVTPVDAHARVTGTEPEDGAVVPEPPAEVVVHFDSTPATGEGDPIHVYGPSGRRVDTGDVRVDRAARGRRATAVSVTLDSTAALDRGSYHVAYRVISRDTHLVTGYFTFRTENAAGTAHRNLDTAGRQAERPERGPSADAGTGGRALLLTSVAAAVGGLAIRRSRSGTTGHGPAGTDDLGSGNHA